VNVTALVGRYSIHYYQNVTMMHGLLQTAFFFGYMLMASVGGMKELGCGVMGVWGAGLGRWCC
jgi:hypothetical protein